MLEPDSIHIILKYFPDISGKQQNQLEMASELYREWNEKINLISRKDIDSLFEKHILHSLSITKFITFRAGTRILDVGTGGGFPGIPLAIIFPEVEFVLCDSIAKKIHVAENISETIGLMNTDFVVGRVEQLKEKFHFITSRAVAPAEQIFRWTNKLLDSRENNSHSNGYLLLKGGDLHSEFSDLKKINKKLTIEELPLKTWFEEEFFASKKLVYIY